MCNKGGKGNLVIAFFHFFYMIYIAKKSMLREK